MVGGDRGNLIFFTWKNISMPWECYNPICEMRLFWGKSYLKINPENVINPGNITFLGIFFQNLYQI